MSRRSARAAWGRTLFAAVASFGLQATARAGDDLPQFGRPLAPGELAGAVAIAPSGAGLPPGHGTAAEGRAIYENSCVACHGARLQGVAATDSPALVGGRGTLASAKPIKTVESYWPYATTLFDYVKRAMPFNAPGSLGDDQVYAVVAYVLATGHVIAPTTVIDATSLPAVRMPNRDGFLADPR